VEKEEEEEEEEEEEMVVEEGGITVETRRTGARRKTRKGGRRRGRKGGRTRRTKDKKGRTRARWRGGRKWDDDRVKKVRREGGGEGGREGMMS